MDSKLDAASQEVSRLLDTITEVCSAPVVSISQYRDLQEQLKHAHETLYFLLDEKNQGPWGLL